MGPNILDHLRDIAKRHVRARSGENSIYRQLSFWWCKKYNRPFRDPLLQSYTLEDLIYEYYMVTEAEEYKRELEEQEADKIEEAKIKADEDWADAMEAEEEEVEEPTQPNPLEDPKNKEWVEKEIEKSKLFFGDDFGDDINMTFDDPGE